NSESLLDESESLSYGSFTCPTQVCEICRFPVIAQDVFTIRYLAQANGDGAAIGVLEWRNDRAFVVLLPQVKRSHEMGHRFFDLWIAFCVHHISRA
ncbi:MAG: hypothetical protein KC438_14580, partial [Thermomicrobiales bacterium]|nr:hypothetical protein [Thermomicrobiales bacterium]